MLKTWRRKQLEQRSVHSSSTQLSDLPREGTPLKRNRSVTTAAELMGNGSAIDLRDLKRSPPLPAIKIRDANSNSRPSSSSSSDWLPMKRSGRLPALNWTPPRSITPVLLPSEVRRKQSVPPSILPIDLGESAHSTLSLSPRRPPEGSDLSKPERSASVNSWFPAKEVQYNVWQIATPGYIFAQECIWWLSLQLNLANQKSTAARGGVVKCLVHFR